MSPSRRGKDSDPGGVDGADATGLRDRVARGLLAAPRDAEARPKVKARRPLGRAANTLRKKQGWSWAALPPTPPKNLDDQFSPSIPAQNDGLFALLREGAATGVGERGPRVRQRGWPRS